MYFSLDHGLCIGYPPTFRNDNKLIFHYNFNSYIVFYWYTCNPNSDGMESGIFNCLPALQFFSCLKLQILFVYCLAFILIIQLIYTHKIYKFLFVLTFNSVLSDGSLGIGDMRSVSHLFPTMRTICSGSTLKRFGKLGVRKNPLFWGQDLMYVYGDWPSIGSQGLRRGVLLSLSPRTLMNS